MYGEDEDDPFAVHARGSAGGYDGEHESKYAAPQLQSPLAATRLSSSPRAGGAAAPYSGVSPPSSSRRPAAAAAGAAEHVKVDELGFSDVSMFAPQRELGYRRPRGPAANPFTAAPHPAAPVAAAPFPRMPVTNVDHTATEAELALQAKNAFLADWHAQREKALGMPPGSSGAQQQQLQYQQQHQQPLQNFYVPPPPAASSLAAPRSKVDFHPMPLAQATGPAFSFFPSDAPPAAEHIKPHVTAADVLAGSVEFLPLSTSAGQRGAHGGRWNRTSTWTKIEANREAMRMEGERNARGTAEQVLYRIWQTAQSKLERGGVALSRPQFRAENSQTVPPGGWPKERKLTAVGEARTGGQLSEPIYRRRLPDGSTLLTAAPPTSGPRAPLPPLPPDFLPHRTDRAKERAAMAMEDWNVRASSVEIFNPYDPVQRKRKEELLRAKRQGGPGHMWGLTMHEKQERTNTERERMVYEDCNARGAVRKSSYRFIPRMHNRKMYATHAGPVIFAAGAPFASAPPQPFPYGYAPGAAAGGGGLPYNWALFASTPQEAWKLHHATLKRERSAMAGEDLDARTGVRHVVPENAYVRGRKLRSKQEREKHAMALQDRNAIRTGAAPHQGIYTAHKGVLQFAALTGKTYKQLRVPKAAYNLCPHVYGDRTNKHAALGPVLHRDRGGARYYKRSYARMRNLNVLEEDQSTNIQDAHALEGVDKIAAAKKKAAAEAAAAAAKKKGGAKAGAAAAAAAVGAAATIDLTDPSGKLRKQGQALVAQAAYAATLLSHGQAYSQRSRLRYRFVDVPGYKGPAAPVPLPGSAAALRDGGASLSASSPFSLAASAGGGGGGLLSAAAGGAAGDAKKLLDRNGRPLKKHRAYGQPLPGLYDRALSENVNTSYTLIPRWHEPDAPCDPSGRHGGKAAARMMGGLAPFRFDDSKPYVFDRQDAWDPLFPFGRPAQFGMADGWPHGSMRAAMHAWPVRAERKLFGVRALHRDAYLRAARMRRADLEAAHAALPASQQRPPKWKFLSERFEANQREYEEFLAAQRAAQPWDASLGAAHGAFGLQQRGGWQAPGAGGASGKFGEVTFASASNTNAAGVFFSPTVAFKASMAAGGAPGLAGSVPHFAGGAATVGPRVFQPVAEPASKEAEAARVRAARVTQPALSYVPHRGAEEPDPLLLGSTSAAQGAAAAAAAALADDPLLGMEEVFETQLQLNPFRTPAQLASVQSYLELQASKRAAAAQQQAAVKQLRRDERLERDKRKWQEKHDPLGLGMVLEPNTFTDTNARGQTVKFVGGGVAASPLSPTSGAPAFRFGAGTQLPTAAGVSSFSASLRSPTKRKETRSASPAFYEAQAFSPTSTAAAAGAGAGAHGYKHPIFGGSKNPYSQLEAFDKWQAWNRKHDPMRFRAPKPAGGGNGYSFQIEPFAGAGRQGGAQDTSSEDSSSQEDDDDDDPFAVHDSSPSRRAKRKEHGATVVGGGYAATVTFGRDRAVAHTRASSRSKSRGRDGAFGSTAPGSLYGVAPLPENAREVLRVPVGASARARSRSKSRSKSRTRAINRSRSRGRGGRSVSPDDPFRVHYGTSTGSFGGSRLAATAANDTLYPPHRSSVPYAAPQDQSPLIATATHPATLGPLVSHQPVYTHRVDLQPTQQQQFQYQQQVQPPQAQTVHHHHHGGPQQLQQSQGGLPLTYQAPVEQHLHYQPGASQPYAAMTTYATQQAYGYQQPNQYPVYQVPPPVAANTLLLSPQQQHLQQQHLQQQQQQQSAPSSLGLFHTGVSRNNAGFVPFAASFQSEHSSQHAYAAPAPMGQSSAKRIKALRGAKGLKRGEQDDTDPYAEREWNNRRQRDEDEEQDDDGDEQDEDEQPVQERQSSKAFARPAAAANYGGRHASARTQSFPNASHYGGVHVNIHNMSPQPLAPQQQPPPVTQPQSQQQTPSEPLSRASTSPFGSFQASPLPSQPPTPKLSTKAPTPAPATPKLPTPAQSLPRTPLPLSAPRTPLQQEPELPVAEEEKEEELPPVEEPPQQPEPPEEQPHELQEEEESDIVRHFREEQERRDREKGQQFPSAQSSRRSSVRRSPPSPRAVPLPASRASTAVPTPASTKPPSPRVYSPPSSHGGLSSDSSAASLAPPPPQQQQPAAPPRPDLRSVFGVVAADLSTDNLDNAKRRKPTLSSSMSPVRRQYALSREDLEREAELKAQADREAREAAAAARRRPGTTGSAKKQRR